jgi:hypothetical protein
MAVLKADKIVTFWCPIQNRDRVCHCGYIHCDIYAVYLDKKDKENERHDSV